MLLLQGTTNFLDKTWIGNSVADYLLFTGLILAALLLLRPVTVWLVRIASGIAKRFSDGKYGKLFMSLTLQPLYRLLQSILFYIAINRLDRPFDWVVVHRNYKKESVDVRLIDIIDHVFLFFAIIFLGLLVSRIIDFTYRIQRERARIEQNRDKQQILPLMKELIKMLWWATAFFTLLGIVFHVNIPALITGLGIGGVAIALAGKETVENLFASFTILVDKPFQTGDKVKLGNLEGSVEKIGFRSTRLRNSDGSVYIIPNKKLVDENLENLSDRQERRVKLVINIRYGISYDQLSQLTAALRDMVKKVTHVKDPVEITLETFGENSFQLLLSYHLPEPLPDTSLTSLKQEISMKTFSIGGKYVNDKAVTVEQETKPEENDENAVS